MPPHDLIETLAFGLLAALIGGFAARRIGLSPIVGYLLAGVAVGPHTPGFVADAEVAAQMAEVGVVLLMFGVGLHFSARELWAVRRVAVPGALVQSGVATGLGLLLGLQQGWSLGGGLVFGMALSVASTVVLMRGLMDAGELKSSSGRLAVGWLVVEDVLTVFLLVLLPALVATGDAGPGLGTSLLLTVGKFVLLATVVFVGGSWLVPRLLNQVARLQSRELFTLAVLTIALGIAYGSAAAFGMSMALGAFLGGMVVGQSGLSHQAGADALPMRDAFAVLFFVSVGMLFDPAFVVEQPGLVLASLLIVLLAKPLVAFVLVLGYGYSLRSALTVGASLAQVGEFSFILAELGRSLEVLPQAAQNAILATALLSISLNPPLLRAVPHLERWLQPRRWLARWTLPRDPEAVPGQTVHLSGHVVLCGHGRVGSVLAGVLRQRGWPHVVIEQDRRVVEELRRNGVPALFGDAANPLLMESAHVERARLLLVCTPDLVTGRLVIENARRINPELEVVARVHSEHEREYLHAKGRLEGVAGELELALEMARLLLHRFGVGAIESQAAIVDLRRARGRAADTRGMGVVEIVVPSRSEVDGKKLAEIGLGPGVLVVSVLHGGEVVVPSGQTVLRAGDTLLVMADLEGQRRIEALLAPRPAAG